MIAPKIVAPWLLALAASAALSAALSACAKPDSPTKWTLWYIPGAARNGSAASTPCRTYVFATPDQSEYAVGVMKGWNGANPPTGPEATMFTGESVTGPLEIGTQNVHDASNGHDFNVNVIYLVQAYIPAKLRADYLCNVAHQGSAARTATRVPAATQHPIAAPAAHQVKLTAGRSTPP